MIVDVVAHLPRLVAHSSCLSCDLTYRPLIPQRRHRLRLQREYLHYRVGDVKSFAGNKNAPHVLL
jgi:hypothetical protein